MDRVRITERVDPRLGLKAGDTAPIVRRCRTGVLVDHGGSPVLLLYREFENMLDVQSEVLQ